MTSTFSPCSCTTALSPEEYDDYTKYTLSTVKTHSTGSSDDTDVLNAPYRNATPLFRAIEKENWEGVHLFLTTGRWATSFLQSSNEHLKSPSAALQVKTWVTAYDRHNVPEWSQLPLHAAISYNAPFVIIQKLIEHYPKSVQCTDNEGMLPIHLAYGFGAPDTVLELLIEPFPASVNEKGLGGRYPYECCELGPNKSRGEVYRIVTDQVTQRARKEFDNEWREVAASTAQNLGLEEIDISIIQLQDLLHDLMKENKMLREYKKKVTDEASVSVASVTSSKATHETRSKITRKSKTSESSYGPSSISSRKTWGTRFTRQHI